MKKTMRKAMILAMALVMTMASTALADTIVSPVFHFPSIQQRPTEAPAAEPTEEIPAEPTAEPAEQPVEEPAEEPAAEPTQEPAEEPVEEPAAEPEQEPLPEPTLIVTSNLTGVPVVTVGTEMVLTLAVEGAEGYEYTIQWQQSADGGATWTDVPGATGHQLKVVLDTTHTGMYWRVNVDIVPPAGQ